MDVMASFRFHIIIDQVLDPIGQVTNLPLFRIDTTLQRTGHGHKLVNLAIDSHEHFLPFRFASIVIQWGLDENGTF